MVPHLGPENNIVDFRLTLGVKVDFHSKNKFINVLFLHLAQMSSFGKCNDFEITTFCKDNCEEGSETTISC